MLAPTHDASNDPKRAIIKIELGMQKIFRGERVSWVELSLQITEHFRVLPHLVC